VKPLSVSAFFSIFKLRLGNERLLSRANLMISWRTSLEDRETEKNALQNLGSVSILMPRMSPELDLPLDFTLVKSSFRGPKSFLTFKMIGILTC